MLQALGVFDGKHQVRRRLFLTISHISSRKASSSHSRRAKPVIVNGSSNSLWQLKASSEGISVLRARSPEAPKLPGQGPPSLAPLPYHFESQALDLRDHA
jgi:hypothetical protein